MRGVSSDVAPGPPSLLYVVKQLELVTRSLLDEALRPAGVTTLQYTALTVLARRDETTSADLARLSFVRAQSISDLVAGLDRRGLIARTPDPANRRRLLIRLTPAGRDLMREYDPRVAEIERRMLADFDPGQVDELRLLLDRARRALVE